MRALAPIAAGLIAVMLALGAAGAWLGHRDTALRLHERGEAMLTLAADRLTRQIDRYRYLPAVLSRHPQVVSMLAEGGDVDATGRLLQSVADTSGALDIYLMDREGTTVAASNWQMERSFVGQNFAWRPYFRRAITGGLGYYHAVGSTSGQRGFYFSHPVHGPDGGIIGVLTVKLDLPGFEAEWTSDPATVFFNDERGVIFLSNRQALVMRTLGPLGPTPPERFGDARQYSGLEPKPLAPQETADLYGIPLWLRSEEYVPDRALWLSQPVPTLGLTANVLVSTGEAAAQALLWGALGAAVGGMLCLASAIVWQRRRALRRQLAAEEAANQRLEAQVAARTEALSHANRRLRAEVADRTAAEAQLRAVQDQLVQAGKLRALGEMSAGISHELNQPLTAIRALADNAGILAERGRPEAVAENLGKIGKLADRAARIIRNLRAFARNEAEPATDVDLGDVIADALEILAPRVEGAGAVIETPEGPLPSVHGGRVRLQQVLINLVSNSVDAMEGQAGPRLVRIGAEATGDRVRLTVRDSGPGLTDPDRIFDPFFTTKPVGAGLGLGLSISYGIVQSFGGDIRGENCEGGGAMFTIDLPAARGREAAA
ncbi:sensor histidine kinase [Halovulum sp. GXIMD14794]